MILSGAGPALLVMAVLAAEPAPGAAAAPPSPPRAEGASSRTLDSVVAVITAPGAAGGRTIVTATELELEARVAMIGRGAPAAAEGAIPEETLARTLDWLVAEHLLAFEAEQLAVASVEPTEVGEALVRFRDRFASPAEYEAFLVRNELTEIELGRVLRRNLVVARYLDSRLRLSVAVSDDDVRRAYDARRAELGRRAYEDVRVALRTLVEKEKREELTKALIADLRGRAQVRILADLGARRRGELPRPPPRARPEDLPESDE